MQRSGERCPVGRHGSRWAAQFVVLVALALIQLLAAVPPAPATPSPAQPLVLKGQVKTQVEGLRGQAASVQADIDRLDDELERLTERYNQLTVELDKTNSDLVKLRSQLRTTRTVYDDRRQRLNDRVTATYKAGHDNLLEILLLTRDLNDFLKRLILISKITASDQRLVEGYQTVASDMGGLEQQIMDRKSEAMRLERAIEDQRAAIDAKLTERKTHLAGVNQQIAQVLEQERRRQEEERRRLEAELRARLQAEAAARGALAGRGAIEGIIPADTDPVLKQVVETAAAYLGVPYLWGGELPSQGLDCSGLVLYVFRQHGVDLPHFSGYQVQLGVPVPLSQARPGDLIGFGNPTHHVAIYIGGGKIIEAPRTGDVVKITPLSRKSTPTSVRRFPLQPRVGPPLVE